MAYKKTRFNKKILVQDLCGCPRKGGTLEKTIQRIHKKGTAPTLDTFKCKGCGSPMGVSDWDLEEQTQEP